MVSSSKLSLSSPQILSLLLTLILISPLPKLSLGQEQLPTDGHRRLLGFKETPAGANLTFDCSPSGPCVPCQYSEKSDAKYRCSETGYRIPFKCVKIDVTKEKSGESPIKGHSTLEETLDNAERRTLADNASGQEYETQGYVTYRSCIQAANEERLSVLGFEVLMLGLLLVSGSWIFFKRKQTVATAAAAGGVRIQNNPRF